MNATAKKTYPSDIDSLNVGEVCMAGYGSHMIEATFLGWRIEDGRPLAKFADVSDGMEWDVYIYENRVSVGSSADPLKIRRFK